MAATSTLSPTTLLPDNNNNTSPGITGTEEPEYSLEDYAYYEEFLKVAEIFDTVALINRYYLWPLFALGFPGNCAAIVTIFRMRSCIGTFPVFVVMLAVMDSLAISVKLLYYQLLDHKLDVGATGCNTLSSGTTKLCWAADSDDGCTGNEPPSVRAERTQLERTACCIYHHPHRVGCLSPCLSPCLPAGVVCTLCIVGHSR